MSRRKRTSCAPPRRTTTGEPLVAHSASAGCSTSATSVCRNVAAVGAVDRAVVAGQHQLHDRRDLDLPVADDRLVLDRADGEDRDLRRVEDGGELLDAEHAEVRDRERPALEVRELQLVVAGPPDEVGARAGDLLHGAPVRVADDRDDEPLRRGDGDPDVRGRDGAGSPRR